MQDTDSEGHTSRKWADSLLRGWGAHVQRLTGCQSLGTSRVRRTSSSAPLSKPRNRHLQTILIEAAKMAPRYSLDLAMIYDRERQRHSRHVGPGSKVGGVLGCRRLPPQRLSDHRKRKPHRRIDGREIRRFLQRAACQVSPLNRLGNGAQAPEVHFDSFRDWQESTKALHGCRGGGYEKGIT
jgi:hypothetical protein